MPVPRILFLVWEFVFRNAGLFILDVVPDGMLLVQGHETWTPVRVEVDYGDTRLEQRGKIEKGELWMKISNLSLWKFLSYPNLSSLQ